MPRKRKGQRADGLFQCKRKMPDGKYKVFYGKTKTEAEAKYIATLQKWEEENKKFAQKSKLSYSDVAEEYAKYITAPNSPIRRGTVKSYLKHIRPTKAFFGDMSMEEIDAQAIKSYLDKLHDEGKAKKTAENARSVISCVFSYWCNFLHGTQNPVRDAKIPKKMPVSERKEPTEEQRKLIELHPEGCGFWAQLFEYTGMRLGEANGLQWKDVDFDAGVIRPAEARPWDGNQSYEEELKTAKAYRAIPILDKFRPRLEEEAKAHQPDDYVLSGSKKPLTKSQYEWRWAIYCRPLGLSRKQEKHTKVKGRPGEVRTYYKWAAIVTAHQFRHLYASNLFYAGVPDKVAQKLMGHADITTTRRVYQQLRDNEDLQYTEMLNQYLAKKDKLDEK